MEILAIPLCRSKFGRNRNASNLLLSNRVVALVGDNRCLTTSWWIPLRLMLPLLLSSLSISKLVRREVCKWTRFLVDPFVSRCRLGALTLRLMVPCSRRANGVLSPLRML